MSTERPPGEIAADCAQQMGAAFDEYQRGFDDITRRARERFSQRNWKGAAADALERLDLFSRIVNRTVEALRGSLSAYDGTALKQSYSRLMAGRDHITHANTFFNSVTRRIFAIVGVNPSIEFTLPEFTIPRIEDRFCPICTYFNLVKTPDALVKIVDGILRSFDQEVQYRNIVKDADRVAQVIKTHFGKGTDVKEIVTLEIIASVFYRDNAAYLIGRIRSQSRIDPLVIALQSTSAGAVVDAVLLTQAEISILFSFTRAYFHVDTQHIGEMVNFLSTLMPEKRVSEIYTSIGFHKHGKAELYRELMRHLITAPDQFVIAPGQKGMVMLVFTLPSFDVVFKVIKDRFDPPKIGNRDMVCNAYRLVFRHDRAGRLVDAQEFEHFKFDKAHFSPDLLEAFQRVAAQTVDISEQHVTIKHLYAERRLVPLDIYLAKAEENEALEAVLDFGRCIKELAATNIFPGDLFPKNFGVTRHGRVIFYDYDELTLLTECRFRKMPPSFRYEDEMASEPWFFVGENDVFPEEFQTFFGIPIHLKSAFESAHSDLYNAGFWKDIQNHIKNGAAIHTFSYKQSRRFVNLFAAKKGQP